MRLKSINPNGSLSNFDVRNLVIFFPLKRSYTPDAVPAATMWPSAVNLAGFQAPPSGQETVANV